jgi:pimeloyl-ACP methyl ester carboxylesterase
LARFPYLNPKDAKSLFKRRQAHHCLGLAVAFETFGLGSMPPLENQLAHVQTPLAWIYGSLDPKFKDIAQCYASQSPQGSIHSCPQKGHSPHLEDPTFFGEFFNTLYSESSSPISK